MIERAKPELAVFKGEIVNCHTRLFTSLIILKTPNYKKYINYVHNSHLARANRGELYLHNAKSGG